MVKRGLSCLLLAIVVLAAACSDEGTGPDENLARLRVVHADPQLSEVDVVVDDLEMASDLLYLDASEYLELEPGSHRVAFATADGTVDDLQVSVSAGEDYTVFPCCAGFAGSLFLTDDNSESPEGNARLRVIHFAGAPTLDVYLTAPFENLDTLPPTLASLQSFGVSDYLELSAGDYQIRATTARSKNVLIDGGTLALNGAEVRTAVVVDAEGGGEPFSFLVLEDAN
jgi:hypothetical protein